jgi:hypothetical protein
MRFYDVGFVGASPAGLCFACFGHGRDHALGGPLVMGTSAQPIRHRMWVHALSGVCVLLLGLWLHGQDGKMSTYMALVLVAATVEWLMQRAWIAR